ncbi:hypothetical protein U1Q18_052218 [Sarracenia purpurea var. burkii]
MNKTTLALIENLEVRQLSEALLSTHFSNVALCIVSRRYQANSKLWGRPLYQQPCRRIQRTHEQGRGFTRYFLLRYDEAMRGNRGNPAYVTWSGQHSDHPSGSRAQRGRLVESGSSCMLGSAL